MTGNAFFFRPTIRSDSGHLDCERRLFIHIEGFGGIGLIFKNTASNQADIITLAFYHPRRGGSNPDFDEQSMQILSLKARNRQVISSYYRIVDPLLGWDFAIAVVPSSDSARIGSGIGDLAQLLAGPGRTDATSCLVRHTTIPKLACGGDRKLEVHLNSIRVARTHLIRGREVLLLDDIATTGNSLRACRILLEQNGASLVKCLALAETAS
jgi:phosphoribosylpyrophosphate synthetase